MTSAIITYRLASRQKMKKIIETKIDRKDLESIFELKKRLKQEFPDVGIILYGSKARGDDEQFSDIDLLILLDREINSRLKEKTIDIAYDIELKYNVVFSIIIRNKEFWNSIPAKTMPLHWNIDKEGVLL